ncbi:putative GTP cyclohydrolase 1 type 2 [Pelotomaculum sp. FP]|uniref:Nif3-like dinuclear metal center hexameric protein n=1 Tax=Pelotomaculum sp. FP TaxID=261474 RepID=UPI0010654379|nr:Nif3-like dinuclear metal center hexameric protein [Pelotomaculum sp. FP]TEB15421.1 putative GTP cyclohydrolase 1 type 2 [Pelotomaculum sp. FP]
MPVKVSEIIRLIEEAVPPYLAEKWDNSGFQLGAPEDKIARVLLALDVNPVVAAEAREKGAGLIVSHHPLFFKPVKAIRFDRAEGELIRYLISHKICVYAAHTNLDLAEGGVNTALARRLGLNDLSILQEAGRDAYFKLAVFVPMGHLDQVRSAIAEAGAGWIGNYSHCTFAVPGTGTFKPLAGANPFIGSIGEIEQVQEIRLETVVPAKRVNGVLQAMSKAHPYEEVAYDLYRLDNPGAAYGLGRVGALPQPMPLGRFAEKVKDVLGLAALRFGGSLEETVSKVAVCGGSGADLWEAALSCGADTLVTSDIKYHTAQQILDAGLKFVDPGHYGTEAVVLPELQNYLRSRCRELNMDIEVILSETKTDPFEYL